ncbi:MAG TPA: UvrD-helicase domain-containing protein, partial [Polyangiales bacterium]|nr:UvrD-helicase domain-containing protein [Polyangiales bacterium]
MSDLGQGMNPEQLAAVVHPAGPLVVFAGAGSGKTRVITHRVAQLIQRGVPPWRILAVTFTNKAARELRERLEKLVPGQAKSLWVGTFHAVCARLLRAHADAIGIRKDFVIYDDSDQRAMLARVLRGMNLDERRYPPKQVQWRINWAKQEGISAQAFEAADPFERVVRDIYVEYEQRMAASSALDFGDLIFRLVHEMRGNLQLRHALQERWEHVLVDEFQDVNRTQSELVQTFCEVHRNLCVVGDDDQSIYRWRGADRRNILDFRRYFPDATVIKLEQNYRSTQRILRVAHAVVSRNLEREPKQLWTENPEGSPITVIACDDERDEANTVVSGMRMLLDAGYARNDIALLYRVHAQSRVFEELLRHANLPYRVIGGLRFYDRAEVKDLLAYLRVVQNPEDDVSLLRIINTPARGIGKTTVERLVEAAARAGSSVHAALVAADDDLAHSAGTKKKLMAFLTLLQQVRETAQAGMEPSTLARMILRESGYLDALRTEDTPEADSRMENLEEVVVSMEQFEAETENPTLSSFLELVTLETDADRVELDDAITLMTVHAAKGLEFPIVMVAGLEEETFPHRGFEAGDDPEELEEERRLAYVAFTRARERLFLSYAQVRRLYGEMRFRRRSRFIDEMPESELHWVGLKRPSGSPQVRRGMGAPPTPPRMAARASGERY